VTRAVSSSARAVVAALYVLTSGSCATSSGYLAHRLRDLFDHRKQR